MPPMADLSSTWNREVRCSLISVDLLHGVYNTHSIRSVDDIILYYCTVLMRQP